MRGLFWKEWHETRLIIPMSNLLMAVLFIALVSYCHYNTRGVQTAGQFSPILLLIWSVPAALCSAAMIAPEVSSGSLQFLASIPVSRNRVWWIKASTAAFTFLLSVVTSTAVFGVMYFLCNTFGLLKLPFGQEIEFGLPYWSIGLLVTVPIFAVGTVTTVLAHRTVTALVLLIGIATALGLLILLAAASLQNLIGYTGATAIMTSLVVVTCLYYSNRAFVKGETLRTSKRFTILLLPIFDIVVVIGAIAISLLWLLN